LRWWTLREEFSGNEFNYPLSASHENIEEPFRTVLAEDIETEREKRLRIDASYRTLQDKQDEEEEIGALSLGSDIGDYENVCGTDPSNFGETESFTRGKADSGLWMVEYLPKEGLLKQKLPARRAQK
jgi:hypothetical protein